MTIDETTAVEDVDAAATADRSANGDGTKRTRLGHFADKAKQCTRGKLLSAILALVIVASAGLVSGLVYFQYRPDQATNATAAKSAISAATDGAVAVLSYSSDTLDRDFSAAKSHLTGDFLAYYSQFTHEIVAPAVKQKSVKTTAAVLHAAVSELHPNSAVVLLFVNQSTASADRPQPTSTASSVLVTLAKSDGNWRISSFDPV